MFFQFVEYQILYHPPSSVCTVQAIHCLDTWQLYNSPAPKCKTSWLCSVFTMLGSVEESDLSNSMVHWAFKGIKAHRIRILVCECTNLSTSRTASPSVLCLPLLRRWFLCCCWSPVAAWKFSHADWVTSLQLID